MMIDAFKTFARRGLFLFDAETAHGMSITALKSGVLPACRQSSESASRRDSCGPALPQSAWHGRRL